MLLANATNTIWYRASLNTVSLATAAAAELWTGREWEKPKNLPIASFRTTCRQIL